MDDRWLSAEENAEPLGAPRGQPGLLQGNAWHRGGRLWKLQRDEVDEVDEWVSAGGATTEAAADQDAAAQTDGRNDPTKKNTP